MSENARTDAAPPNLTSFAHFTLAEPEKVRAWLAQEPASLLVDSDFDPAADTLSDGPINTLLDDAPARMASSQDPPGEASASTSPLTKPTTTEASCGPLTTMPRHSGSPADGSPHECLAASTVAASTRAYDVLETAVAAANECLAQLDSYAS